MILFFVHNNIALLSIEENMIKVTNYSLIFLVQVPLGEAVILEWKKEKAIMYKVFDQG